MRKLLYEAVVKRFLRTSPLKMVVNGVRANATKARLIKKKLGKNSIDSILKKGSKGIKMRFSLFGVLGGCKRLKTLIIATMQRLSLSGVLGGSLGVNEG